MPKDPIAEAKLQRDSDKAVLSELTEEIEHRSERTKHCLQALITAAVPLDCLTAQVLCEIGQNMGMLIHSTVLNDE